MRRSSGSGTPTPLSETVSCSSSRTRESETLTRLDSRPPVASAALSRRFAIACSKARTGSRARARWTLGSTSSTGLGPGRPSCQRRTAASSTAASSNSLASSTSAPPRGASMVLVISLQRRTCRRISSASARRSPSSCAVNSPARMAMVPSGVFSSCAVPAASVPRAASRSEASASVRARSNSSPRRRSASFIRSEKVEMKAAATTKAR